MPCPPTTEINRRHVRWIDCHTLVSVSHQDELDAAICALDKLKVTYDTVPILGVEGLTAPDIVYLKIAVPTLSIGLEDQEQFLVYDEEHFDSVESTLAELGSHIASYRLCFANISLISEPTLRQLSAAFEAKPTVFTYGLHRT
jgi:hypothetical protein